MTCDILKSSLWLVMWGLSVPDASDGVVKRKQEPIYPQDNPNKDKGKDKDVYLLASPGQQPPRTKVRHTILTVVAIP